jgi:hypothetical protein
MSKKLENGNNVISRLAASTQLEQKPAAAARGQKKHGPWARTIDPTGMARDRSKTPEASTVLKRIADDTNRVYTH